MPHRCGPDNICDPCGRPAADWQQTVFLVSLFAFLVLTLILIATIGAIVSVFFPDADLTLRSQGNVVWFTVLAVATVLVYLSVAPLFSFIPKKWGLFKVVIIEFVMVVALMLVGTLTFSITQSSKGSAEGKQKRIAHEQKVRGSTVASKK
jgi:hypothetical protein